MSKDQPVSQLNPIGASPHVIRLHGPWQYEPLAITEIGPNGESTDLPGELPPVGTVRIPANWAASLGTDFRGRVLYKRRFGRPEKLEPNERIDLVLQKLNGAAVIRLNECKLGEVEFDEQARRFELTNLLLPRNELHIEINVPRGSRGVAAGGIVGEVHLEIYEVSR